MQNHIVIMAGGIGSRFWPMSTPEYPKQFIDVMGVGKSLIQLTVERFKGICPKENFWVVTSEKYVDIVKEQLPQVPAQHILAEPEARNTAPCIAYACWKIRKEFPQANIVVAPSDALVIDTAEFGWSDPGSWGSLRTLLPQDEAGNAKVGGRVDMYNCRNCVVHAAEHRQVVLEGLEGYIVAEKDGRLLVCRLSEEQRIKDFAAGK